MKKQSGYFTFCGLYLAGGLLAIAAGVWIIRNGGNQKSVEDVGAIIALGGIVIAFLSLGLILLEAFCLTARWGCKKIDEYYTRCEERDRERQ